MRAVKIACVTGLVLAGTGIAKNVVDRSRFVVTEGQLSDGKAGEHKDGVHAGHGDFWGRIGTPHKIMDPVYGKEMQENPIVLPPGSNDNGEGALSGDEEPHSGPTLLRTQMAVTPVISIFASYVRGLPEFEMALGDSNAYTIVLAPANEAFTRLTRKPWEFPREVGQAKTEQEEDEIISSNIRSFVEHHVFSSANEKAAIDMLVSKDMIVKSTKHGVELLRERRPVEVMEFAQVKNGILIVISETLVSS
jgi:hypothetical protein